MLVDAENVRRSRWPNVSPRELEERCRAWAEARGLAVMVVWERPQSADETIAALATELRDRGAAYWLVTSDRELRERAGGGAQRVIGGGSFLSELLGER